MSEPSAPNGTHDNPQVVEVKGGVPANVIIRIFVIGFGIMLIVAVVIPLLLRWHDQDARITRNRELSRELQMTQDRLAMTQRELREFVSEQCITAETRDIALVTTNNATIRLLRRLSPKRLDEERGVSPRVRENVEDFIQSLKDANLTLEPEGETDCDPGPEAP